MSTEKQADQGVSLEAQHEKIKAYAKLYDLEFVDILVDAGASAKNLRGTMMTRRQHEMIAKYLADLSKGVLIAALIGVSTGKVHPAFFALDVIGAILTVWVAYRLESLINDEV